MTDHDTLLKLVELVGEFKRGDGRYKFVCWHDAWILLRWSDGDWHSDSGALSPWQVSDTLVVVAVERWGLRMSHYQWPKLSWTCEGEGLEVNKPTAAEAVLGVVEQIEGKP